MASPYFLTETRCYRGEELAALARDTVSSDGKLDYMCSGLRVRRSQAGFKPVLTRPQRPPWRST